MIVQRSYTKAICLKTEILILFYDCGLLENVMWFYITVDWGKKEHMFMMLLDRSWRYGQKFGDLEDNIVMETWCQSIVNCIEYNGGLD